ncbi:DUF3606 domain-containing protein [Pedobacter agri]|uniref:DUF3606 domain-containing protein n=1 Tax=Pedobacter agri TaxID=454586 RepID=A0A9X3DGI7_9SPHI|nr:DUF3606 domain-containing protein [Pedobacter agri]MCX3265626.1 DUF3606 domain-containing protein [Pedobacter agri]
MSIPSCFLGMDDKRKQDGRDDAKVDLNDPNEVSYAAQQAGVSVSEYRQYAKDCGSSSRKAIADYIAQHKN